MANVTWGTPETPHIALQINSAVANNARFLGGALNPSGYLYSAWQLDTRFHVSPSAGGSVDLYLIPTLDGNNYVTGELGITPPATVYVGSFPTYMNANSGMSVPLVNVSISPFTVKPMLINSTGQTIPANSGTLTVVLYNENIS